ncbi:MAG: DUF3822 family protein [Bacteroidota bacterium]|nr:DUF3822 family protein [Bacteroidota bacterium]
MNTVFEILPEAIFFQQTNLICEVSSAGFSCIFENDVEKKIHGLSVFYFEKGKIISEQLKELFKEQTLLSKKYKKVFISYSFSDSALLPEELYKPEENELILNSLLGDLNDGIIFTDFIADKKLHNVYKIPVELHHVMVDQFSIAAFYHQYSFLIKQNTTERNLLSIIFYQDKFIAVLVKNNKFRVIQMYPYQSATDVVYHLLNICKQYTVVEIPLRIAGIITADADLHKEIMSYFPNYSFYELPPEYEYAENIKVFPSHYFSHLFSYALCV